MTHCSLSENRLKEAFTNNRLKIIRSSEVHDSDMIHNKLVRMQKYNISVIVNVSF